MLETPVLETPVGWGLLFGIGIFTGTLAGLLELAAA